jgi:CBS domain-containing protein
MRVKDVMTRGVTCVDPDDPIQAAAGKMRDLNVGSVPVCGHDGKLAGMLTDRDIAVRAVAEGFDPTACRVADVMSEGVEYCYEDDDTTDAARRMEERQIRRVLVLDDDKKLVGIVSLGDLAVGGSKQEAGEVLREVSEPSEPRR